MRLVSFDDEAGAIDGNQPLPKLMRTAARQLTPGASLGRPPASV